MVHLQKEKEVQFLTKQESEDVIRTKKVFSTGTFKTSFIQILLTHLNTIPFEVFIKKTRYIFNVNDRFSTHN